MRAMMPHGERRRRARRHPMGVAPPRAIALDHPVAFEASAALSIASRSWMPICTGNVTQ